MKERLARVGFVLLIWGLTSLASLKAFALAWRGDWEGAKAILRLQDKAAAQAQWGDARYTVSAQCDVPENAECWICRLGRALLGAAHFQGAAVNEGLRQP